jgi:four helix bundle protein
MYKYSFEKLDVWQKSKSFSVFIYKITKDFPSDEKFGITNQLRRASVSIASNIAEGISRISYKEQARFSEIAFGSLMEVLNQIIISKELGYLEVEDYEKTRMDVDEISNKLNALKKAQISRIK